MLNLRDVLDRYNTLPYKKQSKIGYDMLIQIVILRELINKMGTTITDLEIELKKKISRIKYLESKKIIIKDGYLYDTT